MEIMNISHVHNLLMSAQTSSNNMVLVQDPVLGAYLLSKKNPKMEKGRFFDLTMYMENVDKTPYTPDYILKRLRQIRRVTKEKCGKAQAFTGRGLLSLIIPEGLNYTQKLITEEKMVIYDGVIVEGHFDKKVLGSSKNTIIQVLYKKYSAEVAGNFINNLQFVVNQWLYLTGFSIGLEDCIPQKVEEIQEVVTSSLFKAESIKESSYAEGIKEIKIANILGNARDNGMVIAKKSLKEDNNFLSTILSGSKGDFFNIAQIVGLLGQQTLNGKRITPTMCHGKKVIPHYPSTRPLTIEEEYESRGFVSSSFSQGLTPREYFAHARSGREGVTHTAMSTSRSGYAQRKAGKLCEDLQVKYDGTVRNVYGTIFQNVYAGDGFDRSKMVTVDGELECMDIYRIVDEINLNEEKNKKKKNK